MRKINNNTKRIIVGVIAALLAFVMVLGAVYPFF